VSKINDFATFLSWVFLIVLMALKFLHLLTFEFHQIIAILVPLVFFHVYYFKRRDVYDLHHAVLGKVSFLGC